MGKQTINGQEFAFTDVKVNVGGKNLPVTGVKYKRDRKKENIRVNDPNPRKRSYGDVEYESSLTVLLSDFLALEDNAPESDITLYEPFEVVISWRPKNVLKTKVHVLKSAEFLSHEISSSQGDMKSEVELPLIISDIDRVQ